MADFTPVLKYLRSDYSYYDTPDGKDCFKKIGLTTKYGLFGGLLFSFNDIVMMTKPKDLFGRLARVAYWTGPGVAMGATFGSVACALTNIRNKDDPLNYLIAGFVAGSVWAVPSRSSVVGIGCGVAAAAVSCFFKYGQLQGWNFGEERINREYGYVDHYKRAWTFVTDPKDEK